MFLKCKAKFGPPDDPVSPCEITVHSCISGVWLRKYETFDECDGAGVGGRHRGSC